MIMSLTSSTWNKTVAEGTEGGRMEGEENEANGSGNERANRNRIGLCILYLFLYAVNPCLPSQGFNSLQAWIGVDLLSASSAKETTERLYYCATAL